MPRNPSPEHYIGYEVTRATQTKITFSNDAIIKGDFSESVVDAKGKSLEAVDEENGIALLFTGSLPVDVTNMRISDPRYPEKEYPYPFEFDPETPPERDTEE